MHTNISMEHLNEDVAILNNNNMEDVCNLLIFDVTVEIVDVDVTETGFGEVMEEDQGTMGKQQKTMVSRCFFSILVT